MWYQLVFGFCFYIINVNAQTLGGFCRTPLNEAAKCISVWECQTLLPLIRSTTRTAEQTQFLHSSRCGFDSSSTPYVCCGKSINIGQSNDDEPDSPFTLNPLIPDRNKCGFQWANRIYNGEPTAFDEFPWMAILQYIKPNGQRKIACAGSLINSRYVLTAAHCVTGDVLVKIGQLINVRLGEYDTSSPGKDCAVKKGIRSCNNEEVNIGVEKVIPHPQYTGEGSKLHDIALIRLASEVNFSEFIQPICLPLPNDASSRPGDQMVVAGWGKTEKGRNSNVKLKLQIPVTSESKCNDAFSLLNVRIGSTHICAGGESGKDSCTGDSGGPLMRTLPTDETRWMLEGVVSFGYNQCGTAGYPGVYTRISKYVSWIHRNVRQ